MSFHGIPLRYAEAGDPYPKQCAATARALAARLDLAPGRWHMAYQSRFGREPWLAPELDARLTSWGQTRRQRCGRHLPRLCCRLSRDPRGGRGRESRSVSQRRAAATSAISPRSTTAGNISPRWPKSSPTTPGTGRAGRAEDRASCKKPLSRWFVVFVPAERRHSKGLRSNAGPTSSRLEYRRSQ